MRRNLLLLILLFGSPALAFLIAINRSVPLVPLSDMEARCAVCDRRATRTLPAVAESLRTKRLFIYRRSDYRGGIPAWCDQHGPDKLKANAGGAYFGAITAFALAAGICAGVRKRE